MIGKDDDGMCLEVRSEFSGYVDKGERQFLHGRVSLICSLEGFSSVVN